jgi:hypothetical protein
MARPGQRIPEEGEWVQMGKYATAWPGLWGQVIKVDFNPPPMRVLGRDRVIQDRVVRGASGGIEHTEVYIQAHWSYKGPRLAQNGKLVVVKASPYELEGALLDERPNKVRG